MMTLNTHTSWNMIGANVFGARRTLVASRHICCMVSSLRSVAGQGRQRPHTKIHVDTNEHIVYADFMHLTSKGEELQVTAGGLLVQHRRLRRLSLTHSFRTSRLNEQLLALVAPSPYYLAPRLRALRHSTGRPEPHNCFDVHAQARITL